MTTAVAVARPIPAVVLRFNSEVEGDHDVRERSKRKRAEILEAIEKHPDADPGLRRQAGMYRRRLEAGMEGTADEQR